MALKENARFAFGLKYVRAFALNPDGTKATPERTIGGVGPFDLSGITTAATAELIVKIDGTESKLKIDISGVAVADNKAVTVTELVNAINLVFQDAEGPIDLLASKEATTNVLLIASTKTATNLPKSVEVYGQLAELVGIGQGFGTKVLVSDTIRSMAETAVRKDSERITTTDGGGADTDMITDG